MKQIYFLRHGEYEFNKYYSETNVDPMLFDAILTPLGRIQAINARQLCINIAPQLIVTSSLRRAIDTLLLAVPIKDHPYAKYEVWNEHIEYLEASCDIGSPKRELITLYPELSFDTIPNIWWYTDPECNPIYSSSFFKDRGFIEPLENINHRINQMIFRLYTRSETNILIIGHADFFNILCDRLGYNNDIWLQNGEIIEVNLKNNS